MYIVNGKNYCRIDMNCVYVNWLEEARFTEPCYQSVGEASEDIAKRISEQLKYDDE